MSAVEPCVEECMEWVLCYSFLFHWNKEKAPIEDKSYVYNSDFCNRKSSPKHKLYNKVIVTRTKTKGTETIRTTGQKQTGVNENVP